ncbi:caspase family protein [Pseudanabaena sp. 'Roaring Creek']|uniref:caspase family protein n=1 Tax=Pseudanabaena sp. 'Roaring Creek' TaxID=1681830 RepID=UPI0006D7B4B1|nr:caspase family protein [Pseudanabaena sp. 'Roaring Creek']
MYPVKRLVSLSIATGLAVFTVVGSTTTSQQAVLAQDVTLPQQRQLIAQKQSRIALVIGNAAYDEEILANPVNDAEDIAAAFKELGFDEVILLKNQNKREIEDAIEAFSRKLHKGSVGVFYYAGHGVQVDKENYLIPIKARLLSEKTVRYEAVPLGRVLDSMKATGNLWNVVILDACRDTPWYRKWYRSSGNSRGLTDVKAPRGIIVAYATEEGSVAADGTGQRNSPYTSALLETIKKADLDVRLMFGEVVELVVKKTDQKQVPSTTNNLIGGNGFYLNPTPKTIPPISNLIPPERKVDVSTANTNTGITSSSTSTPSTVSKKMQAFLKVIRFVEGTDDELGYNRMKFTDVAFKSYADHPRQINCTLDRLCTDAAGAYMFLSTTWDQIRKSLNLKDFSPSSQDKSAIELIKEVGAATKIENGDIQSSIYSICTIWAEIPCSDGKSAYGQQSVPISLLTQKYQEILSKLNSSKISTSLNVDKELPSPINSGIGKLMRPINKSASMYFGWRPNPITGETRLHKGVDFIAESGTDIFAAESGEVIYAGYESGYGDIVEIDHGNGLKTLYAHCSKIYVKKGDRVFRGQVIAAVGSTGNVTGDLLHFEVLTLNNGSWMSIDPTLYLDI